MPWFGQKKKNIDRSDSWSLGKSGLKSQQDSKNDPKLNGEVKKVPAPNARPESSRQPAPQTEPVSTEPTRSFVAELDGSTISSLPPSQRGGGSVNGSEPTGGPSTTATSDISSPTVDLLTQELLAPDSGEKQAVVSTGLSPKLTKSASEYEPMSEFNKEVYVPSRSESNVLSMAVSAPSVMSRGYREYNYYNTTSFKDLVICDPSQRAIFYAEISSHTRSKSDVELREFSNEHFIPGAKSMSLNEKEISSNTRIVAVADFVPDENASQIKLAIGDPLDPASNSWVIMKNVLRDTVSGAEKFDMIVPGTEGGKALTFQWIKTGLNDDSQTGEKSSDAKEAYKLMSENGVVASFRSTSMTNVRKRGALRVYEVPMVDQYLLLIFLSASAMSEMYRRRRTKKVRRTFLIPF